MKEINNEILTGERALFGSSDLKITDCIFENGESPLKESKNIMIEGSMFKWKYPLWYCRNVTVTNGVWGEIGRAGVWYTDRIRVTDSMIEDLYVLPGYQNHGYGSDLLHFAISECSDTPTLWILENNQRAERLYRREGFKETGRRNVITDGLDEIEFALC